ncbi:MAG: bifunctional diaminohydroxyphosphoribosylaminopyrimidine deaminase/5-amino-6-(5-phosphoribosylamino)uracil reductase RibD [Chloroherpetonaceae bacterium]|nr:bifunctional diaminohydroxyphosphoribosylaminopyrimidine deaminase/5-amino-6-(5-phosphoribosylamino)uracil reductase RibD [Chloroherpetonaceae bacterium]MCS7212404.1 bifunctional diaminohydroxyphosphoribosylaminopyrimidine deaminase/5-amino-6-(5-phosphoribosylamino)uracil reductase RibD [Chloroherpetonaceae bacterium]MDW8019336.1 bifunctional diaminohydroxyphosphoribosylaminopyrimidine deaminase/5-amino-6-(5-phosphoribosylamino)uracil reductase RibD [Chloroherpetonaceae bacterium]
MPREKWSEAERLAQDERYMRECFQLARRGVGKVSPNPMVGAVLVHQGKVIGRGWHKVFGGPHAEVNAIQSVKDPTLLQAATLYVNLEPCAHYGKTPPCTDLIIEKKIPRVVVGCKDPYKKVSGRGIKKLREAGIEVTVDVLKEEAEQLNEAFIKYHTQGIPFVALKLAQSLDGKIATKTKESRWITSEAARAYAHQLRAEHDAVMIGTGTALADNPLLTVRAVKGRNPIRILLDRKLRVPLHANLFNQDAKTILFTSKVNRKHPKIDALNRQGVATRFVAEKNDELSLVQVMEALYEEKVLSVLVEGGAKLFASLIRAQLCDKLYLFIAPKILGADALSSIGQLNLRHLDESVKLRNLSLKILEETVLLEGYF